MIRWQYCLRFKLCNLKFTKIPNGKFLLDSLLINDFNKKSKYKVCLVKPSSIVFYNEFLSDIESCLYFLGLNSLVETRYSIGLSDFFSVFSEHIEPENFKNLFPYIIEAVKKRDACGIFEQIDLCGEDLYWSYNKIIYLDFIYHRFCVNYNPINSDIGIDINKLAPRYLDSVIFSDSLILMSDGGDKLLKHDAVKYDLLKNCGSDYEF